MDLIKKNRRVGQEENKGLRMDAMLNTETIKSREYMQGGQLFSLLKLLSLQ